MEERESPPCTTHRLANLLDRPNTFIWEGQRLLVVSSNSFKGGLDVCWSDIDQTIGKQALLILVVASDMQ